VISKRLVWEAYLRVKANQGAPGNLYRIWNRMSSAELLSASGKGGRDTKIARWVRILGVPTVADRIAQTVVAMELEGRVEPMFHRDSYGYRPRRSALDAVGACRKRCWEYDWVIDLDIQKFFDSVDHSLMIKVVEANTDQPWVLLYVKRWLVAPIQHTDGSLHERDRGTPQGSAISPVLANLERACDMENARSGTRAKEIGCLQRRSEPPSINPPDNQGLWLRTSTSCRSPVGRQAAPINRAHHLPLIAVGGRALEQRRPIDRRMDKVADYWGRRVSDNVRRGARSVGGRRRYAPARDDNRSADRRNPMPEAHQPDAPTADPTTSSTP
jgi:hypothetical protein